MRDIQEIIKEMNNLNNQIAATLNEEDEIVVAAAVQDPPANCNTGCFGTGGESETNCNDLPGQTTIVPFTCQLFAPNGFRFPSGTINNPPIIYDVNCLHCFVEPCNCTQGPGSTQRFAVRLVGCISFVINAPLVPQSGQCRPDGTPFLCCNDSVCVDNTICFGCGRIAALIECGLIESTLAANPCNVRLSNFSISVNPNHTDVASISGNFILPSCVPLRGSAAAAIAAE